MVALPHRKRNLFLGRERSRRLEVIGDGATGCRSPMDEGPHGPFRSCEAVYMHADGEDLGQRPPRLPINVTRHDVHPPYAGGNLPRNLPEIQSPIIESQCSNPRGRRTVQGGTRAEGAPKGMDF